MVGLLSTCLEIRFFENLRGWGFFPSTAFVGRETESTDNVQLVLKKEEVKLL